MIGRLLLTFARCQPYAVFVFHVYAYSPYLNEVLVIHNRRTAIQLYTDEDIRIDRSNETELALVKVRIGDGCVMCTYACSGFIPTSDNVCPPLSRAYTSMHSKITNEHLQSGETDSVVELSKGEVGGLSKVFYQLDLYFY